MQRHSNVGKMLVASKKSQNITIYLLYKCSKGMPVLHASDVESDGEKSSDCRLSVNTDKMITVCIDFGLDAETSTTTAALKKVKIVSVYTSISQDEKFSMRK